MMHPVKNLKTCTRTLTDDSQDVDLIVKDYYSLLGSWNR